MEIETYGAFWDTDNDRGLIQLRGTNGTVLPNGNLQLTSATKFTAVLTILESSRTAVWDEGNKRIRTGTEVVQE
ncbi:MAG: hypothetical protein AAF229_01905 [Pseudomonadota bacterium]